MAPNMASCAQCNTTGRDLKLCNSCKTVVYCNRACQKAHWKAHKVTCRQVKVAGDKAAKEEGLKLEAMMVMGVEKVGEIKITPRSYVSLGCNEQGDLVCMDANGEKLIIPKGTKQITMPDGSTMFVPLDHPSFDKGMANMSEERKALFREDTEDMVKARTLNMTAQEKIDDERDRGKLMEISAMVKAMARRKPRRRPRRRRRGRPRRRRRERPPSAWRSSSIPERCLRWR